METIAALLDGFVSIIYANYYLYFNGNKQGYYSYFVLTAVGLNIFISEIDRHMYKVYKMLQIMGLERKQLGAYLVLLP